MFIFHLYIFFGEVSVKLLGSFYNWAVFLLLSFKSSLYILGRNSLSEMSFVNIFSQPLASLLILLKSFAIISFVDHAYDVISKTTSPYPRSFRFSPILLSMTFRVLHLNFRSMILWVNFLWRVWNWVGPCGAPRHRALSLPRFLLVRLQLPWPSLSSKGWIPTVANQGRSSQETTWKWKWKWSGSVVLDSLRPRGL